MLGPPCRRCLPCALGPFLRRELSGAGSATLLATKFAQGNRRVVAGLAFFRRRLYGFLNVRRILWHLAGEPGHSVGGALVQVTGALLCA